MKTRKQRAIEYQNILDKLPAAESAILPIAGVISVSVGLKLDDDEYATDQLCFRVYYNKDEVTGDIKQQVPAQIDNVDTQVAQINMETASAKIDKRKYRPLYGGSHIKSANSFTSGTLGCFVTDDESDDVFLLSNYHVLMINNEESGHQVAQPDFCCEAWPCRCGEIAKIERGVFFDPDPNEKNHVDCAIASLSNGQEDFWTNKVLALGYISGIPLNGEKEPIDPITRERNDFDTQKPYVPLLPGETVFKRGISTRKTEGIVVDVTAPAFVNFETRDGVKSHLFRNQIFIAPKRDHRPFTRKGDSGSVVVNHLNQVVGLYFADNEVRNAAGKVTRRAMRSYANPIQHVLKKLNISIPDTGTLQTLLLRRIGDQPESTPRVVFDEMNALIEKEPEGPALLRAFTALRQEVLQLINHNREVKVAWHRCQGPSFVAHLAKNRNQPGHAVPVEINGVSFQRMLTNMSVVLEKNGSPALATAIGQYATTIMGLAKQVFHSNQH